jgi:hypothetical protein
LAFRSARLVIPQPSTSSAHGHHVRRCSRSHMVSSALHTLPWRRQYLAGRAFGLRNSRAGDLRHSASGASAARRRPVRRARNSCSGNRSGRSGGMAKTLSSEPSMTTVILPGLAPRATNVLLMGCVGVMTWSAKRMLSCSNHSRARTAEWRDGSPNSVARNSSVHSCRSSRMRAPSTWGTAAARTRTPGPS